jgi:hypothetical protein
LLQGARIEETSCVNFRAIYIDQIVAVREIHKIETNARKAQCKWCNAGVADG